MQVMFASMLSSIEYIRTNKLRPLAVTTKTRSVTLPDIPTVAEFVSGYEASSVYGLGAPKSTPADIIDKLNKEINVVLTDTRMKARIDALGSAVLPGSPADFRKLLAAETEKWGEVVKLAGIRAD